MMVRIESVRSTAYQMAKAAISAQANTAVLA